jgi:hypothetical protein
MRCIFAGLPPRFIDSVKKPEAVRVASLEKHLPLSALEQDSEASSLRSDVGHHENLQGLDCRQKRGSVTYGTTNPYELANKLDGTKP